MGICFKEGQSPCVIGYLDDDWDGSLSDKICPLSYALW